MTACQQRAKINMMYNDKTSHRNAERRKKKIMRKRKNVHHPNTLQFKKKLLMSPWRNIV